MSSTHNIKRDHTQLSSFNPLFLILSIVGANKLIIYKESNYMFNYFKKTVIQHT